MSAEANKQKMKEKFLFKKVFGEQWRKEMIKNISNYIYAIGLTFILFGNFEPDLFITCQILYILNGSYS